VPSRGGAVLGMQVPGSSWDVLHVMGSYHELGSSPGRPGEPCWSLGDRFEIDGTLHCLAGESYRATLVGDGLRLDCRPAGIEGLGVTRRLSVGRFGSELRCTVTLRTGGQPLSGVYRPRVYLSLPPSERSQVRLGDGSTSLSEAVEGCTDLLQLLCPKARLAVSLQLPEAVSMSVDPVRTDQRDRGAIRQVHQGQRVELAIPFELRAGEAWSKTIVLRVQRHR